MDYVQFGRSGMYVSRQAFGTWRLNRTPADEVDALIGGALDAGINMIDTARGYANGEAEGIVGRFLKQRGGRDNLVVATKSSGPQPREPNGFLTTRRSIVQHCEASLKSLGVDYIDLYQLHCAERFTPIDEALGAMTDLVKSGKVRYIGTSNFKGWQLVEACWAAEKCNLYKFTSDQSEYHLFDRRLERENFAAMQTYGMAALIYSPLCQGLLSGRYYCKPGEVPADSQMAKANDNPDHFMFSPRIQEPLGKLVDLANRYGKTASQMALAFVMKHPVTAIPIIAPRNSEQLTDCLGACDITVDAELSKAFDAINPPGEKIKGQKFNAYNHGPSARWF